MKKYLLVLPVITCVLSIAGCSRKPECIELRISSQEETYEEGKPVAVNIEFRNHCDREVVIMNPLWEFSRIYCEFRDSAGELAPMVLGKQAGRWVEKQEYIQNQVLLGPKQSHGGVITTNYDEGGNKSWELHPGTYTHWCEYRMFNKLPNVNTGKLQEMPELVGPLKKKFWFGHIKSNVIQIVIKGKSASKRTNGKK